MTKKNCVIIETLRLELGRNFLINYSLCIKSILKITTRKAVNT